MRNSVLTRVLAIAPLSIGTALLTTLGTGTLLAVQLPLNASAAPQGITVSGNQFLLDGEPFVPHGFDSIALLNSAWCSTKSTAAAASNFNTAELNAARNIWNANTLRFHVSQPVLAGPNGVAYAQQVQTGVDLALNDGFVVDISMQDESTACGPSEPLPSAETETAWTTLINNTTIAANPNVMFELFNEPDNSPTNTPTTNPEQETWVDWLNGGRLIQPKASQRWAAYIPVGHQELVNYMRTTLNVTNVLLADGASDAEHLEGIPILSDPGSSYQIAYAVHPYYFTPGLSAWNTRWGYLASTNAVIATEWNYDAADCSTSAVTVAPQFLSYMRNTVNIGILGQALDDFGSGNLVANTALAPTQCGTASPGAGYVFMHDYTDTFSSVPAAPTGLSATPVSGTEIDLSWNASTDINGTVAGYNVYRDGSLIGTTSSTSYPDTDLTESTPYTYSVAAYDTAGNVGAQSTAVTATTPDGQGPDAPTGLTASPVGGTQVNLSWNASTDANGTVAGYDVYRNGVIIATIDGTSYSDTGLTDATSYNYTVDSFDTTGNTSAQSEPVTAVTSDTQPPSVPSGLSLTLAAKSINLAWNASADNVGVAGYKIYRNGALLATSSGPAYSDTAVVQGKTYSYTVAAYDAAGNVSAQSAAKSIAFPDTTPPTMPTKLSLTPATTSIALSWTASTDNVGVAGYYIYRASTLIATVKGTGTTYTSTGLKAKTTYSYHVVAFDAAGNRSAASSTVSAKTK
jgi:chitodextrinase